MTVSQTNAQTLAQVLDLAQRRLELLSHRESLRRLIPVLREAMAELKERLERVTAGSFSETMLAQVRLQILAVVAQMQGNLDVELRELTKAGSIEGAKALERELRAAQLLVERSALAPPLPVKQLAQLTGAIGGERSLVERFHLRLQSPLRRYSEATVRAMEREVAVGLASAKSTDQITRHLVQRLPAELGGTYWRAERIARTEISYAYNATRAEEARALPGAGLPGIVMRWTEHVSDMSRRPLDKRVGEDSVRMHGQLRLPGEAFYDPVNRRSIAAPPSRPNDRAVVSVWRVTWGEPPGGLKRLDAESRAAWQAAQQQLAASIAA